jgi:hypothetical protein
MGMDRPSTETPKARQAFEDYYNLGPKRSIAKLYELYRQRAEYLNDPLNRPPGIREEDFVPYTPLASQVSLEVWSSTFGWQDRIRERMEQERDDQLKMAIIKRKDAAEQRLKKGTIMQEAALHIIRAAELNKLSVDEARKLLSTSLSFLTEGMKVERLELGEERASFAPDKPVEEMSDEELRDYAQMLDAASNDPTMRNNKRARV